MWVRRPEWRPKQSVMCGYCNWKFCSVCNSLLAESTILAKENNFWTCLGSSYSLRSTFQAIPDFLIKIDALSSSIAGNPVSVGTVSNVQAVSIICKMVKKKQPHNLQNLSWGWGLNSATVTASTCQCFLMCLLRIRRMGKVNVKWLTVRLRDIIILDCKY